jgi:hypothetical protein
MVAVLKLKHLGIVMALAVAAVLGCTTKATAQTLDDVRADVESLFANITLFNQALNQIGHDANLILKKCRYARSAIGRKKAFLNGIVLNTIDAAIAEANLLDSNLDLLDDPGSALDQFETGITQLQTDVATVGLHTTRLTAILADLNQIALTYIPEIQTEIEDLQSKSQSLLDILDDAHDDASPPIDVIATRTDLNNCHVLLRSFDVERRTIVISKKSPILRLLNEIRGLLRQTGPLAESGVVSALESQQSAEWIDLGRNVASIDVQIYAPDGRLLSRHQVLGNRLLLGTEKDFANGVYLYVLSTRGVDGKILHTTLKKFVVRH